MGTIRLLLALSVVAGHVGYQLLRGVTGQAAVQAFFIISGFYIAMALDGSYKASIKTFWINRGLRLFPVYWFVAALTLLFYLLKNPAFFGAIGDLPSAAKALLVVSNAVLFGQDWVMFTGVHDGATQVVKNFRSSTPQLWTLMLSPPAWSLGIELTFYAVAPFIYKGRTRTVVAILAASLVLRGALITAGFTNDPWTYRFFPTELALFLLGGLAYRALKHWRASVPAVFRYQWHVTVFLVAFIMLYPVIRIPELVKNVAMVICFAAFIGLVFEYSKDNKVDNFLGELSYPLYISHWLVILAAKERFGSLDSFAVAASTIAASLVFAVLLAVAIDIPVQKLRKRIRDGRAALPLSYTATAQ